MMQVSIQWKLCNGINSIRKTQNAFSPIGINVKSSFKINDAVQFGSEIQVAGQC